MTIKRIHLPEERVHGKPLGRHVAHDSRSRLFPAPGAATIVSVTHKRLVPIFDQGQIGSCTGNAGVGAVSTSPFSYRGTEKKAIEVYSKATTIDSVPGSYPPSDTGSDGLSVMRVLRAMRLIAGYTHAFSIEATLRALVLGPGIIGMAWRSGCDTPDSTGRVRYTGAIRGGHEVCADRIDVRKGLVWIANSWGAGWGRGGWFAMTFDDLARALSDHGDACFPALPVATLARLMRG